MNLDRQMVYAPIMIPTMNRYRHLKRAIESLKKNIWAEYTDVYIGVDFPPSEKYRDDYNRVLEYLEGDFSIFHSFNVIKRDYNYGSIKNIESLREMIFKEHDRLIKADDDAEFSPNFIEYMDKCLMEYENDPTAIAVTGYSYPLYWSVSDAATIFRQSFICPMWGVGLWKQKFISINDYIVTQKGLSRETRDIVLSGRLNNMTDICRQEFTDLCLSPDFKTTLAAKFTDISMRIYMSVYDKYVISPVISKVRNWGFDGSGEYCAAASDQRRQMTAKNYPYHLQRIDENRCFTLIPDSADAIQLNKDIMNKFDPISFAAKMKMFIKLVLFVLVGKSMYAKITHLIRKFKNN